MIRINVLDILHKLEDASDIVSYNILRLEEVEQNRGWLTRHEELELAEYEGRADEINSIISYIENNMGD